MALTSWILSILGVILLGVLVDMLMSESRLHNYVKAIISIFTVFVVVAPIPSLLRQIQNASIHIDTGTSIDINNDYAQRQAVRQYEQALKKSLADEGWRGVEVSIKGKVDGVTLTAEQITLDTKNLVIDEKNAHINKYERLRALTAVFLNVNAAIIVIV